MFVYLSKKIVLPEEQRFISISWNSESGCLACGGRNGVLKILKLEEGFLRGTNQGDGFTMKCKLEMDTKQTVNLLCWNEIYQKLTTCDEKGLMVVWMSGKETWHKEMINDRGQSFVADLRWSKDGKKIIIAYDDGTTIVGSVDGQRIWGKNLKMNIRFAEWSPDNKLIILGTKKGELKVYDMNGAFIHPIRAECLKGIIDDKNMTCPNEKLAAIEWYWGSRMNTEDTPAGLVIAFANGRVQLMKNESDLSPLLLETSMSITCVKWNASGSIFAIGGFVEGKCALVQFYDSKFNFLRSLRIAGQEPLLSLSWDGTGLKLSLVVGAALFFASVKPRYKWASMTSSIAYAFEKENRVDFCVMFHNIRTGEKVMKYTKRLCGMVSHGDSCAIVSKTEDSSMDSYSIVLCNSMGNPIESKEINIEPSFVAMTKSYIVVASNSHVYLWQYKMPVVKSIMADASGEGSKVRKLGRELAFFIDEVPNEKQLYDKEKYNVTDRVSQELITCVDVSDTVLIVGRGKHMLKYSLPNLKLEAKIVLNSQPTNLRLNCDSSMVGIIDIMGLCQIYEFSDDGLGDYLPNFERKDVWDFLWSRDTPNLYVFMEKYKLTIGRGAEISEPFISENYLCDFSDLTIRTLAIDEILKNKRPELALISEYVVTYEMGILKEFKESLEAKKFNEAYEKIAKTTYVKPFRALAEACLENLEFQVAEKALLKCDDYKLLQFVKRLQLVDDKQKQKAEVLAYHCKFLEAEDMYKAMERKDLAVELAMKMGEWGRVIQMVKDGFANDEVLVRAYNALGTYYADRFDWGQAIKYFEQAKNYTALIEAYYCDEQYLKMGDLVGQIRDKASLLELANKLQTVGMCNEAAEAFEKADEPKRALDCCILLNTWDKAMELAEKHNFPQVETVFSRYATQLLQSQRKLETVELYRKANKNTEAAKILQQIANDLIEKNASPILIKKLYVIAALEVEQYKNRVINQTMTGQTVNTSKTLASLITSTITTNDDKALTNPWRGAEAWHFFILAQKQLAEGEYKKALITSIRLQEYELQIDPTKIFTLTALAAYHAGFFKQCSRAFMRLETLPGFSSDERELLQEVANTIFSAHAPDDPSIESFPCIGKNCTSVLNELSTHCKACGSNFTVCYASGRPIFAKEYYTCTNCRHKSLFAELRNLNLRHCSLCHTPLENK